MDGLWAEDQDVPDPSTLKDVWLRQALRGGCLALSHADCYDCNPEDTAVTVKRTVCVIPGSQRLVSLSEHLLAALGMQKRQGSNKQLQFVDVSDMGVLRKWAGDLRSRVGRRKLKSLGAQHWQINARHDSFAFHAFLQMHLHGNDNSAPCCDEAEYSTAACRHVQRVEPFARHERALAPQVRCQ